MASNPTTSNGSPTKEWTPIEPPILQASQSLPALGIPPVLGAADGVALELPESRSIEPPMAKPVYYKNSGSRASSWTSFAWWIRLPGRVLYAIFQFLSLVILLAVVSAIPILQLASLGYLLEVSRRIADPKQGRRVLPGIDRATRIGVILAGATLTWLPVWLVSNYAYSAELIEPGSVVSQRWHIAAWIVSLLWVVHVAWAALRGGCWYHFLWPAPIRFLRQIWRPSTWQRAEDSLWNYTVGLKIPSLMWLGFRGFLGGLMWLAVPAGMMVIGLRANEQPVRALIGFIGALLMTWVILYVPFLQVQMARENRFSAFFDVRSIRRDFKRAPWAYALAFFVTLLVSLPLYIFRIESLPKELLWLPCVFFVLLTLPARMLVGWAMRRGHRDIPKRHWLSRWGAWGFQIIGIPAYVLFLYLSTLASWDGALIILIQHAFLLPVPLSGT